ncbi:RagB/SusD family nutrient uptake outer membrane protein [Sphingobacterium rhinopitheci]|uniref:RagB/SusD family nutrient uptake outer membrane protein n=1 Tax=Sphingobacterium rhinopitheci TaxID=2781960 RepID=UPI001F523351|nr:RagB/SusD family nutrient uptake outer membrane protein [Sphingobacterium rhinopitheci]MCI0920443.1 RagB/SusD family nutrient uptake outer membrane protein [Sphingobacterium rhinopitheci]
MKILNRQKTFAGSIVALALMFTTYSCKDFTELNPLSSLSETTAFTSPQNIELAVSGMYWQAAVGSYDPLNGTALGQRGYPFGGASIEQGDMRGEDLVNLQAFFQVTYQNTYTPNTPNNVNIWEQLYALINQCNVIIEGVDNAIASGVLEASVGNPYKGEALFLRALAHHELLLNFSKPYSDNPTTSLGVPYRVKAITGAESAAEQNNLTRGSVASTYALLLADLDLAESILPTVRANKAASISRATKGAAIALKTRVKLHMNDMDGVIAEGAKLGTSATTGAFNSTIGGYALENSPETPFINYSNNSESIFSVAQSVASNGTVNGAVTSMFSPSELNGRDLIGVSPNLYNASFWLATDLRKTELTFKQTVGDRPYVYVYKYRSIGDNSDWCPMIRYSEVLLNVSEAYAYKNNEAQALKLLNAVRDRSAGVANSYGNTAPSDLKKAIYDERRIEFFGEGKRWGDLHRLAQTAYGANGIPAKLLPTQLSAALYDGSTITVPSQAAVAYTNKEFLWPIPQRELDSNPTLRAEQNNGW